jgi:hypothetical protein
MVVLGIKQASLAHALTKPWEQAPFSPCKNISRKRKMLILRC